VREVFGHMEDSVQPGDVKTLNDVAVREILGPQAAEDAERFSDGLLQPAHERPARQRAALGKFRVAIPHVKRASEPCNNPLADVPA